MVWLHAVCANEQTPRRTAQTLLVHGRHVQRAKVTSPLRMRDDVFHRRNEPNSERTRIMLRNTKDLDHYAIKATDGEIGHVKDFYFDDDAWAIRYLVVDAGVSLPNRKVLISPISVEHPNWLNGTLSLSITKEQVRRSPDIDTDKPVSRQHEVEYMGYFGYPYYWAGAGMWGGGFYPYAMAPGYAGYRADGEDREEEDQLLRAERRRHRYDNPHLRSCKAVTGYHLHATDGEVGHVSGFLIDDETWAIRYVVVDTSNWWMGHQVLIAPEWITGVQWPNETVSVALTRTSVKAAPSYDPDAAWDREQDLSLYRHHGRAGYWADSPALEIDV